MTSCRRRLSAVGMSAGLMLTSIRPAAAAHADVPTREVGTARSDTAALYAAVRARYMGAERSAEFREAHARSAAIGTTNIPAFARKYGMKCSACHNAVPELNEFGRAFRDNGFRMNNGNDDLRTKDPSYWPIFAWAFKNYGLQTDRAGGTMTQQLGGISNGSAAFGILGSIGDHVSVRYVPQIYEDGTAILDQGYIRYNRAFNSDWVNIKIGASEFDLPWSPGRDLNVGDARFATMWAYTVPGSISAFSFFDGATGVEVMGHDQGSRNRYAVSAFSTTGAMAAHTAWAAPGVFGHVTHRIEVPRGFVRDVDVGLFGAYATWPYGPDSSTLGASRRFGGEIDSWLLSDALPLHVTLVGMHGNDDRGLVHNATANTTFNAGLLQVSYVPAIPLVFFGRLQAIRNTQAVAQQPDDFGDQNFYQLGARHALEINSRFAWIVELSYSRQQIKRAALDGSTAGRDILWAGTHLIF